MLADISTEIHNFETINLLLVILLLLLLSLLFDVVVSIKHSI